MLGDIILVNGTGFRKTASKAGQLALRLKLPKFSHAALLLGSGRIIHATGTGGVSSEFIKDFLDECKDNWKVLRHPYVSGIVSDNFQEIYKRANYQYGKKYSLESLFDESKLNETVVCSNLIARFLSDIGILDESSVCNFLPEDLNELDRLGWKCVTEEIRTEVKLLDENDRQQADFLNKTLAKDYKIYRDSEDSFEMVTNLLEVSAKFKSILTGVNHQVPELPRIDERYWHEQKKHNKPIKRD